MAELDFSKWEGIPLKKIFYMSNTKSIVQKNIIFDSGNVPYVTASGENNGVLTYISCPQEWMDKGNCIMIGGKTLTFTYQESDFCSNDSHNITLHLKDEYKSTKLRYLFLISALRASLRQKYSWGDSISMKRIMKDTIYLPLDDDKKPDWFWIDLFMQNVVNESKDSLSFLRLVESEKRLLDLSKWKRFHLYDDQLFNIDMGTKLDKSKMTSVNPSVNFVGRANQNNGITGYVDEISNLTPYEEGNMTLSLGGEYLGSCFIQQSPFYVSQNVVVLKPRWNMPFNVKMFISVMVFRESRQYYKAFVNELNRHIKTDFSVYLPIDEKGKPNWQYMDALVSEIFDGCTRELKMLRACVA